jgi:hypothetical protein
MEEHYMTIDDIIRIAEEVGVHDGGSENWVKGNRYEDFAKACYAAGAAAEREACAKLCEAEAEELTGMAYEGIALGCAEAIRARGNHG